ncbi:hypothetical protein [Streptomyces sp. NPDC054866]
MSTAPPDTSPRRTAPTATPWHADPHPNALHNVDTADDARKVAKAAPDSQFAATLTRLTTAAGHPSRGGGDR